MAVSTSGKITQWLFIHNTLLSGNTCIFKDNLQNTQNPHANSEGTIFFAHKVVQNLVKLHATDFSKIC